MIRYLVIHHEGFDSENTSLATMKSWPYTKVISKGGRVVNGQNTYHTYGHNPIDGGDALAVCLDGQFEIEKPSDRQIEALIGVLKQWHKEHPNAKIVGHRDLAGNPPGHNYTACPGKNLYKLIPQIREEAMKNYKKLYRKEKKNRLRLKKKKQKCFEDRSRLEKKIKELEHSFKKVGDTGKDLAKLDKQYKNCLKEIKLRGKTIESLMEDNLKLKTRLKEAQGLTDAKIGEILLAIWDKIKGIKLYGKKTDS